MVHGIDPSLAQSAFRLYSDCRGKPIEGLCALATVWSGMLDNAFYAPPSFSLGRFPNGIIVLGEPVDRFETAAVALDVVAHEFAHGVTHFSSRLTPSPTQPYEPVALNEAFSDIIGTGVEFFFREERLVTPDTRSESLVADYLIGEDLGKAFRSLINPNAFGTADHYSQLTRRPGVEHLNSTILSHAFYLAVAGGTNRTSGQTVSGVGRANRRKIEDVFFRAFAYLMPRHASFTIAADCVYQSAVDLYGNDNSVLRAVAEALDAVGIPNVPTCHDRGDCP